MQLHPSPLKPCGSASMSWRKVQDLLRLWSCFSPAPDCCSQSSASTASFRLPPPSAHKRLACAWLWGRADSTYYGSSPGREHVSLCWAVSLESALLSEYRSSSRACCLTSDRMIRSAFSRSQCYWLLLLLSPRC